MREEIKQQIIDEKIKDEFRNGSNPVKKKKGETRHHISYDPEIVVVLSSRGAHRTLTAFQNMNPTKQNIRYLKAFKKALNYIIKEKLKSL